MFSIETDKDTFYPSPYLATRGGRDSAKRSVFNWYFARFAIALMSIGFPDAEAASRKELITESARYA